MQMRLIIYSTAQNANPSIFSEAASSPIPADTMIAILGQIPRIPEDESCLLPFDLRSDPVRLIPCP